MLARYAELNGVEITTEGSLSAYPDADQVSNYAVAYMTWAVENGIPPEDIFVERNGEQIPYSNLVKEVETS